MMMVRKKKILIVGIAIILVIVSVVYIFSIVYFVSQFWDMALFIETMSREAAGTDSLVVQDGSSGSLGRLQRAFKTICSR